MTAYLYLLNTLADWEIGFLMPGLSNGLHLSKDKKPVPVVKVGNDLETIKTMGGIPITPDKSLEDVKFAEGDLLILPGGETWPDPEHKKVLDIAGNIINDGIIIAAICGATAALACMGLLNDRKHTSNDVEYLKMTCPGYSGEANYINQPAVTDGNLITASGLAPLEFAYEIFKRIDLMKEDTLETWYQLHNTKEPRYYFNLIESLK